MTGVLVAREGGQLAQQLLLREVRKHFHRDLADGRVTQLLVNLRTLAKATNLRQVLYVVRFVTNGMLTNHRSGGTLACLFLPRTTRLIGTYSSVPCGPSMPGRFTDFCWR